MIVFELIDLINVINKLKSLIKYIFCGYNNTLLIIENRKRFDTNILML